MIPLSLIKAIGEDERMVVLMAEASEARFQSVDMRPLSWEEAKRLSVTYVMVRFLENFSAFIREALPAEVVHDLEHQAWTLAWRQTPTPRVQIRIVEPAFYDAVRNVLTVLGYEVRVKSDHLVVIVSK